MNYPEIGLGYKATTCKLAPIHDKDYLQGYLVSALEGVGEEDSTLYCCMCGKKLEFKGSSYMCNQDSELLDVVYLITHTDCVEELNEYMQNNIALLTQWFLSIPREVIINSARKGMA